VQRPVAERGAKSSGADFYGFFTYGRQPNKYRRRLAMTQRVEEARPMPTLNFDSNTIRPWQRPGCIAALLPKALALAPVSLKSE
jgi:hypothetical protein